MNQFLALIRHGDYHQLRDTPSAHQVQALNSRGLQQASNAVLTLQELAGEHDWQLNRTLYCSELLRAWQTATLIAEGLFDGESFEVASTMALAERSVGIAANLTIEQIEHALKDDPRYPAAPEGWKSDSHYCLPYPGAESLMTAGERVARYLEQLMANLSDTQTAQLTLVVGHGAAFRHAAHRLGILPFEQIAQLSMYHGEPVIVTCDLQGHWRHVAGSWKLRTASSNLPD